ncbi:hypothetical protein CORT_0B00620 [Candida orthopsilosis Co 90-125]|uniref:Uncharacterized protein n=1 Tax=Candida orthopsilosis (strain 90-125) TaxID=1136231 RepID=H8WZB5_CANO9|nr:hypothetical protein CORT_0B00620 [Candida orthopsilosis Co 90-125]CCG21783.1 hypothetical protein CORT_0B00620 [Candida orthopsilosis Co 90-125]
MASLYGIFFILAVAYAALLYLVNLVPHVSIRYVGFLSLRGVTIKVRTTTVYIGKIALQINAFGPRDESLKWISLMLADVDITCLKDKQTKPPKQPETSKKKDTPFHDKSIKNKLQFHVPTFIYNYLLRTELINKINFLIVRSSIYHESTHEHFCASLEFTRLEAKISKCHNLRVTATLFNGLIFENENKDNKLDLFRNVEFFVNCVVITACDMNRANRIKVNFEEFRTSLSIGRLNIPMEYISTKKQKQSKPEVNQPVTPIEDDSPKQVANVIQYKQLLKDILSLYSLTEIRLEDFTLSYKSVSINLSNFVFSLEKIVRPAATSTLKLQIYVTSFKFYHLDTKCIELPSGTVIYEVCPMATLRVSQALLNHEQNSNEHINFDFSIMLSNPVFDVYYDQEDILFGLLRDKMMRKRMNKMRTAAGVHHKEEAMKKLKLASKMLRNVSTKIVIVDTVINVHLPKIGQTREDVFNRHSNSNTKVSFSVTDLTHKIFTRTQTKKLKDGTNTDKRTINSFLKIKNLKGEAEGNLSQFTKVNLLLSYDLDRLKLAARLSSKAINFRSVNDIFFYLVRQFRNRQRIYFNKKFDEWMKSFEKNSAPNQPNNAERLSYGDFNNPIGENEEGELIKIFEVLPPYVSSVRLDLSSLVFEIKSKEELPSQKIYDYRIGQDIDLKDYRRGISLRVSDLSAIYKRSHEQFQLSMGLVQAATLSEYAQEYLISTNKVDDAQMSNSDLDDLSTLNSFDSIPADTTNAYNTDGLGNTDSYGVKNVLTVQNIHIANDTSKSEDRDRNRLTLTIPEVDGHIDTFFLWCIFYAKTLLQRFAPTVESNCTREQMKQITGPKKKVKLDVMLESVTISIRLPHNVDVLIEFDRSRFPNVFVLKNADIKNIRMYVIHPSTKLWARVVVIKEANFSIDVSKTLHEAAFELHTKSILFNVPNRFAIYTVIDNSISFVKAIKQLSHNFKYFNYGVDKFERVYPAAKDALVFPHIRIKTASLGLALENDPFENELAMIFELGLIEQRVRWRKLQAFEAKSEEIRANAQPDIEDQIELSDLPNTSLGERKGSFRKGKTSTKQKMQSPLRNEATYGDESSRNGGTASNESGRSKLRGTFLKMKRNHSHRKTVNGDTTDADVEDENQPKLTKTQAEEEIRQARERLNHNFSLSWMRKFKSFKDVRNKVWKERREELWGQDDPTDVMKSKYDIVEYADGPTLSTALFLDVDLTLDKFRGGDIDEFLYAYAKKQPKQKYSILVPLYAELTAKNFHMFLKDYPLPLASFPTNSNPQSPTVHIKTNLVVNEHLYQRKEELRYIYVPFSSAVFDNGLSDNFYSVYIPRTLTTVKVAADFQCDLNSDRACIVGWSKSYQPALSTMGQAFENFSKPAIDDSPIGVWDKIPLIMHGKYKFNIANELCLHMKSGRSPYKLVGLNSGFVFNWKNNVDLTIDGTIDPKRLVVITSDDFIFAVPNYSVKEKHTWSLYYDGREDLAPSSDPEGKKYHKKVIRLSSNDRVEWCLGMMFERNKHFSNQLSDQEERTSEFLPHYKVQITNPANEYHPDSYDGYRADYVHMALSVISKSHNGQAFNAAFLTPLAFHHFFYWWDTVAHYSPTPVRSGKLFTNGELKPKLKLSPHLFTVKYQMIFNPVTISHLYIHSSNELHGKKNRVAFTGLKGKFDVCEIDLHQRKELLTYVNQKLNKRTQVKHLKMNQAEINVEKADVRVLNALFPDQSVSGKLLSYLTGDNSSDNSSSHHHRPMRSSKFSKWIESVEVPDGDLSWVDPEDFIELEMNVLLSAYPKIKIFPFFATPKLSYFREFTLREDGPYPFGNEKIHNCLMDTEKPSGVQSRILSERVETLKNELSRKQQQFSRMKSHAQSRDEYTMRDVETDIQLLQDKIDVINKAHRNFTEEDLKMTNNFDDPENLTALSKQQSGLSAYSSHKDKDDLLEAANFVAIAEFHNRFIVHNLEMKWDDDIKIYFENYLERIGDRRDHVYYMTRMAIDLVQNVISEAEKVDTDDLNFTDRTFTNFKGGIEAIEGFAEALDVLQNPDVEEAEHKYLIKLIHPQIQMVSKKAPDSCVIVTSRDLDIKVVDINQKDLVNVLTDSSEVTAKVESRIGVLFREEQIFVVIKDDVAHLGPKSKFAKGGYMNSTSNWPPWFECEVCYRGAWAQEFLVAERNTVALVYKSPNNLFLNAKNLQRHNEVVVFINKYVVSATSSQFSSIFYVVTELLLSGENKGSLQSKLSKIVSLTEASDFKGLDMKVKELQTTIREFNDIVLTFHQRGAALNESEQKYLQILELEMEKSKLELIMIMKLLGTRNKSKSKETTKFWHILTDQVIWHFLTDDRQPFIDIACTGIVFSRVESIDGANHNDFEIKMMQGFNLQENSQFPILLSPLIPKGETKFTDDGKPMVKMTWDLSALVGGIPIIKHAKLDVLPLRFELDYPTAKMLQSYLFPKDDDMDSDDSEDSDDSSLYSSSDETYEDPGSEQSSLMTNESSRSRNPWRKLLSRRKPLAPKVRTERNVDIPSSGTSSPSTSTQGSHESHLFGSQGSSFTRRQEKSGTKVTKSTRGKNSQYTANNEVLDDEIETLIARSLKYKSIIDIEISNFDLMVSFSGPKSLHLLNVNQLVLSIPTLQYQYKIWSGEDFTNRLKKDIIKIILQHTGKILSNKFQYKKKTASSKPLKQISNYEGFLTLEDLQDQGEGASGDSHGIHLTPEVSRVHHNNHLRSNHHVVRHGAANDETYKAYLGDEQDIERVTTYANDDKVEGDVDAP